MVSYNKLGIRDERTTPPSVSARIDVRPGLTRQEIEAADHVSELTESTQLEAFVDKMIALARARATNLIEAGKTDEGLTLAMRTAQEAEGMALEYLHTKDDRRQAGVDLTLDERGKFYVVSSSMHFPQIGSVELPSEVLDIMDHAAREIFPALTQAMEQKMASVVARRAK